MKYLAPGPGPQVSHSYHHPLADADTAPARLSGPRGASHGSSYKASHVPMPTHWHAAHWQQWQVSEVTTSPSDSCQIS